MPRPSSWRSYSFSFSFCLFLLCAQGARGLQWDVHLKVDGDALIAVRETWAQVERLAPHNQVDLSEGGRDVAHVTLFLADYPQPNLPALRDAVLRLLLTQPLDLPCRVSLGSPFAAGDYLMWDVEVSACLQNLSDAVVLSAYKLRNTSAPVPDWVLALPDPPRGGMERMFEEFGSPTVFQYFRPHITLAFDTEDDLAAVVKQLNPPRGVTFVPAVLGIGHVGIGGSVIAGEDLANFTLPSAPRLR